MTKIKSLWLKAPNWFKAACWAGVWAFLGQFGPACLGFLADVQKWASDDGGYTTFPDPAILVKALVASVGAGFTFLVAASVRFVQSRNTSIPGGPPLYPRT